MNKFQEHIGVGSTNYALGRTGPTRDRKIVAEEGPRRGKLAGIETDHASGRVDAKAFVDPVHRTISRNGN